jgi:hypothetical protein
LAYYLFAIPFFHSAGMARSYTPMRLGTRPLFPGSDDFGRWYACFGYLEADVGYASKGDLAATGIFGFYRFALVHA